MKYASGEIRSPLQRREPLSSQGKGGRKAPNQNNVQIILFDQRGKKLGWKEKE